MRECEGDCKRMKMQYLDANKFEAFMLKFSLMNIIINSVKNLMLPCVRHASQERSDDVPSEACEVPSDACDVPSDTLAVTESLVIEFCAPRLSSS